jgi:hypothetical protein
VISAPIPYKQYLASREWMLKREAVRHRSGNKCERCKTGPQDAVHHLTYERVGNELLEDLQAICDPCHKFLSAKSHFDPAVSKHPAEIAAEEWEAQSSDERIPTINYCRAYCENCKGEKIFALSDIKMWSAPLEDFDNFNRNYGRYGSFYLHAHEAYCDGCGEDNEFDQFVDLVRL